MGKRFEYPVSFYDVAEAKSSKNIYGDMKLFVKFSFKDLEKNEDDEDFAEILSRFSVQKSIVLFNSSCNGVLRSNGLWVIFLWVKIEIITTVESPLLF